MLKYDEMVEERKQLVKKNLDLEEANKELQKNLGVSQRSAKRSKEVLNVSIEQFNASIESMRKGTERERLKELTLQIRGLITSNKLKDQKNAALQKEVEFIRKSVPAMGKDPRVVQKLTQLLSKPPSPSDMEEYRDVFVSSLAYTAMTLSSDEEQWERHVDSVHKGLPTFKERQENFLKETRHLNNQSRLVKPEVEVQPGTSVKPESSKKKQQPDTLVGPDGIKFINDAIGFHPSPEPATYPETYNGTVAVIDGASILMCHGENTRLLGLSKNQDSRFIGRPEARFDLLTGWIVDMIAVNIFRAHVIVLREDIVFDVRNDGQFKLKEDAHFEALMEMVCDNNIPVHLIVVPSPCYDDIVIVTLARELLGVIVSKDAYRDLWNRTYESEHTNVLRGYLEDMRDYLTNPMKGCRLPIWYNPLKDKVTLCSDPYGHKYKQNTSSILL